MNINSIVLYKKFPAIVLENENEKYLVKWCVHPATSTGKKAVYASQKVRDKDVVVLIDKPVSSLDNVLSFADRVLSDSSELKNQVEEIYDLLTSDDETANNTISFLELVELIRGNVEPDEVWGIYNYLNNDYLFEEVINSSGSDSTSISFIPRTQEKIKLLKEKLYEKEHAQELKDAFIQRLKKNSLDLPNDSKYMGEIEAFALGKTDKCKTLKDAGFKETIERAHQILLDTGVWNITRNPYPLRWGVSMKSASEVLLAPPNEDRLKLEHVAYAIDNESSTDPDDAIFFDGEYLWVHIADPASTVFPDSSIDKAARVRGATLYIPEGTARMLCEDCLEDYALGLKKDSNALSFRIKLDDNYEIENCEIFITSVKVKCITYEEADKLKESSELKPLFEITKKLKERRIKNGAVEIKMPEVKISIDKDSKKVSISPYKYFISNDVVKESMILAGEAAAKFAFKNNIPFPFISQDAPNIPSEIPSGYAGQYKLRRCMRKRNVQVTPSAHAAMGLSMYSQVTSPLRRYSDLLAHEQLRAFITGKPMINKDDMLIRMSEGDESARAAKLAERNSRLHWTLVYLLQNPDWEEEAICIEKQQKQDLFLIPSLGIETCIAGTNCELNDSIRVKIGKIDLPSLEVIFRKV